MINFEYVRPTSVQAAVQALAKIPQAQCIAGGTNLVDLMKRGVARPPRLIDITALPLQQIERTENGLRIGALVSNAQAAVDPLVKELVPLVAQALHAGASPQLRNMATMGGNLLQRTRCPYFYDTALPCNKRAPGSGCGALKGYNRMHAIFGASEACIAVHPSDLCVALAALDTTVIVQSTRGEQRIPFLEFHRLPGTTPQKDNNLAAGDLITALEINTTPFTKYIHYLKVRDRSSYAFALVSVAAALQLENNQVVGARLALGGVAHKPWRLPACEEYLKGKRATEAVFREAGMKASEGAHAYEHNQFKLKLLPQAVTEALTLAAKAL
jgi:xanthine dehydrogenase YagS FAD-binding subunit